MCQYVPNAKYLAHLAHQIPFDPIYQMCHISYFCNMLQQSHKFVTIRTGVAYGFIIFLFLFLSHLSVSLTLKPQSSPLSHPNPLLSNPNPHCSSMLMPTLTSTLTIEFGIKPNNELDAKETFFSEIKSPNEVGISPSSTFNERFKDSRYAFSVTEVGIFPLSLLAGFDFDRGGWVRLGVMLVWVGNVGVGVMSVSVCCVGRQLRWWVWSLD